MADASNRQRTNHWDQVYLTKAETDVSWFEPEPTTSLELIRSVLPPGGNVIDIGGGASRLVDRLLDFGTGEIAVLDVSAVALRKSQDRLGTNADRVRWIVGDITEFSHLGRFDVWHDRAVFHFLTKPEERRRYAELAAHTVKPGGHAILGVFATDGPPRCSGLDVCRYDPEGLARELGPAFHRLHEHSYRHTTPAGKVQSFCFAVFQRLP